MRIALLALGVWASGAAAQAPVTLTRVRTAVFTETYAFDDGLAFRRVNEITVPVGADVRLGRFADLTISSGWARVLLRTSDAAQLPDQRVSGVLDTEFRLGINAIPGKLIILATGVVPTGINAVDATELSLLGALASDIIGFAAPSVGSGGSVGGGFAGALPLGRFAAGVGATYRYPLTYTPVVGDTVSLRPGPEFRVRVGVEGPVSRTTYLRVAAVFATRGRDELAGQPQHGVGNRVVGYLAVNRQVGRVAATLYGFDVYRAAPQLEATAAGAALLPKGNLLAVGGRFAIGVRTETEVTPRFEYRLSAAEADPSVTALRRLGDSFRFGLDVRNQFTAQLAAILQLGRVTGAVVQGGADIGFSGTRAALHLEFTP